MYVGYILRGLAHNSKDLCIYCTYCNEHRVGLVWWEAAANKDMGSQSITSQHMSVQQKLFHESHEGELTLAQHSSQSQTCHLQNILTRDIQKSFLLYTELTYLTIECPWLILHKVASLSSRTTFRFLTVKQNESSQHIISAEAVKSNESCGTFCCLHNYHQGYKNKTWHCHSAKEEFRLKNCNLW